MIDATDLERVCALTSTDSGEWERRKWHSMRIPVYFDGTPIEGEKPRPTPWRYWMRGAPEWVDSVDSDDWQRVRTVFSWDLRFGPDRLRGWEVVQTIPTMESECPFCGPGSDIEPDPACKVCEGTRYVYGGCAALVVYRRKRAR